MKKYFWIETSSIDWRVHENSVDVHWLVPFKSIINVIENKPHGELNAISGWLIALYEK